MTDLFALFVLAGFVGALLLLNRRLTRHRGRAVSPRVIRFPPDVVPPSTMVPLPLGAGRCTRPVYASSDQIALAIFSVQTECDYWKSLEPRRSER